MTTMIEPIVHSLDADGATITYDVRASGSTAPRSS